MGSSTAKGQFIIKHFCGLFQMIMPIREIRRKRRKDWQRKAAKLDNVKQKTSQVAETTKEEIKKEFPRFLLGIVQVGVTLVWYRHFI